VKVGGKIQLINHTTKEAIVNVAVNSDELINEDYYLVNMYRGEVLFYQTFKMESNNKVFKFENNSFKPGINKLILLDKTLKPISERLLFSGNFEMNNLIVQTNSAIYNKREKIQLQIDDEKYLKKEDYSNLSVLVVHEFVVPENGFSRNILSQLLIDSEISGFVESSADLFVNTEISSEAKLRLVMLTNGYGSYFWNNAPKRSESMNFKQEAGISIKGSAKNTLTGNKVSDGKITIAIQKEDEIAFLTQTTDSLGNFVFPGLLFNDTATVHIQGKNEAGKKNVDIEIEPAFKMAGASNVHVKLLSEESDEPSKLAGLKYQLLTENKRNVPKGKVLKIDNGNNESDKFNGHFRLYKTADFVLEVQPFEQSFNNVLDFMAGKVPGVDINGDEVKIRGASGFGNGSLPLFLIDGVPLSGNQSVSFPEQFSQNTEENERVLISGNNQLIQAVRAIPLSDVEKIEILKSPQNLAAYGVKGANGVIAIYTRRGGLNPDYATNKTIIENRIVGYSKYRQFYSPAYIPETSPGKQHDLKTLLYWNPEVTTKNGIATLSFFSSDLPGKYNIFVEGIDNNGKVCVGNAQFEIK
jgi:parallel beta-helix repeat protein